MFEQLGKKESKQSFPILKSTSQIDQQMSES